MKGPRNWTVKSAKRELNLKTNLELAEAMGVNPPNISNWNTKKKGKIPSKYHDTLNELTATPVNNEETPTHVPATNPIVNNKKVNVFVINTNPRDISLVVDSLSK